MSSWRLRDGVMEVLSEHQCEGELEGYLLTGGTELFNCYEASIIHIIDSMFNQHAKWLEGDDVVSAMAKEDRVPELSRFLPHRLASGPQRFHAPGSSDFLDHVVNKKAEIVRVYLPPDANWPAVGAMDHCLRSPPLRQR